jgi:hypothetical protein
MQPPVRDEVGVAMRQAAVADATIVKAAANAGYVQDPNGHIWEAASSPAMSV